MNSQQSAAADLRRVQAYDPLDKEKENTADSAGTGDDGIGALRLRQGGCGARRSGSFPERDAGAGEGRHAPRGDRGGPDGGAGGAGLRALRLCAGDGAGAAPDERGGARGFAGHCGREHAGDEDDLQRVSGAAPGGLRLQRAPGEHHLVHLRDGDQRHGDRRHRGRPADCRRAFPGQRQRGDCGHLPPPPKPPNPPPPGNPPKPPIPPKPPNPPFCCP